MSPARTIAIREVASLFRVPVGWVVIALYAFLSGLFFMAVVEPGGVASLANLFNFSRYLLIALAPAISMRLLAEESRGGTLEALLTSPVPDVSVVLGKFLGAWLFLALMLVPTLGHVIILYTISSPLPDPGPIAAGYISLLLMGGLYIAIGLLASSLTSNQMLAFIGTLLTLLLILLASEVFAQQAPAWLRPVLFELSLYRRTDDFARGVIDTAHIVFFLSGIVLCLAVTTVILESRRWR